MSRVVRSEFRPFPPQRAFLKSPARIRGYGGALGGGKSRTGCEEIFNACLEHPGIICLVARDAHTSIVETTKKTMLSQVIPVELQTPAAGFRSKASQGEDFVQLFNGSTIHFIGMDNPYRWYSSEVGYIFFDEAQELDSEWDVIRLMNRLRQRCSECIKSDKVDCEHMPCRAILTFNPGNPDHWLRDWFVLGASPTDFGISGVIGSHKEALIFQDGGDESEEPESFGDVDFVFARADDNPYLSKRYINSLKALPPHMRRRYFEGMWEYYDESAFFDVKALAYYDRAAMEAKPILVGHLVGDIKEDIAYRLRQTKKRQDPIRVKVDSKGPLVVWKQPFKGDAENGPHRYVIAIDASSGRGADWTAIQVLDVEEFEQVAELQVKLPPEEVSEIAYRLGRIYNDALVVCEITGGWGFAVDEKLRRELRYPRPYTRSVVDRLSKQWTNKVGFDTTQRSRNLILSALEEAVREKELGLYSTRTLTEMKSFIVADSGKAQARSGAHDDLVMAMAIAVYVAQTQPKQLRKLKEKPHEPRFGATGY